MSENTASAKVYYAVFAVLLALLALTVAAAYVDLGRWSVVAMLTIAVAKAVLIILYFMHVRDSTHLTWLFAGAGFFWLLILLALLMADYVSRDWLPVPTGWEMASADVIGTGTPRRAPSG